MNETAPEGQIFICSACGKRSKDKYGDQKIDRGWDISCMIYSVLCYEEKHKDGFWIPVKKVDHG